MKPKQLKELKLKKTTEIRAIIRKIEKELVSVKLEQAAGKAKNVHLVKTKRQDLAQAKTVLREKELISPETGRRDKKIQKKESGE